jgi:cobalt-zinc-cadmium resistance protein CzcA
MLTKMMNWALHNRLTVLGLTLVLMVVGTRAIMHMAIDAVPDVTNIQVVVNVKTGALDPEKIEMLVTRPIETEMAGVGGLKDMRSIAKFGLSQTTLIFDEGTDIYWARQQVAERLPGIDLPEKVSAELAPMTTGLGEVYMYTLQTNELSPLHRLPQKERLTELRSIQDYIVRPQLKRVKGIADIDSNGGFVKQIHINFLTKKLDQFGITLVQANHALESLGDNSGGGYIQRAGEQVIVRTLPSLSTLADLADFPLYVTPLGQVIKVSDVAIVRVDHALRVGGATFNGEEAILGTALMRVGANGREVVTGIEEALKELTLPEGITLVPLYTRKFLVDSTISTVSKSLVEGAILVIVVLFVLLGHFVAASIVALAIPLSMLFAAEGMRLGGITGNLMSLGAIDFGLLVDGSVVLIETILTRLALTPIKDAQHKRAVVLSSASEVIRPMVTGIFLILVVDVPILTLSDVEGKMFRPMAQTVLLALGGSLFVAIFLMPVLADMFLKTAPGEHETLFFRWTKKFYTPALDYVLKKPISLILSGMVVALLTVVLLTRMGSDFIPTLDEGDLVMGVTRSSRISIDKSVFEQTEVEKIVKTFPEVQFVFARLGTPESATDPMGVNLADTFVILEKDRKKWQHSSKEALFDAIRAKLLAKFPDDEVSATQPIEMRFNEMLEGSRADVALRIFGPDLKTLFEAGEKASAIVEKISGIESVEQDPLTALRLGPVLDIKPDYAALARYGIMLETLNTTVASAMAGLEVGSFFEGPRRFPLIAHIAEEERESLEMIQSIPLDLPRGGTVPLSRVARLVEEERVTVIARQWAERYAAISINIHGRDLGSFVAEARALVEKEINLPSGYRVEWGGQFKNLERAKAQLFLIVPLTLLGVFLILWKGFGDLIRTTVVFMSVPFAAMGGVIALWIRDMNLSVSAGVGFIALIGIALLNALVLVTVLNSETEKAQNLIDAIKRGTLSRLRPVLMTALVAGLGFIPMALNTGIGAEVQRPLATVVIGGLLSATVLTLLGLPVMYLWSEKFKKQRPL